ncbi:YsnF/AvaK domain-containing protein [Nissabacter archeti]|uniref:YsnF/AvaK domain-containing protein n=1 Tax=Nissabacter archeti TaxID=1917880 RepID=UPI000932DCE4|nr:YsnF/AvaK domain-containing protein [Nissabacter archeti]
MAHEKIVTLFDTTQQAEAARKNLIKAGFPDNDISLITGEHLKHEGKAIRHPSIWQRLFGDTVEDDYAEVYTRAMDTGGVILTLRADEDDTARAMAILDRHQAVDVPSRTGGAGALGTTGAALGAAGTTGTAGTTDNRDAIHTSLTGDESEEEILRLAEENLEVGKRLVKEGSTRVRRYVTTEDVKAEVALHEQHADIFRRAVDEPAYLNDIDWSEKVVEVTETHEQPVVNKTAKIVEEVVVRKDESSRVETINDTVRRQNVEVEHVDADRDLAAGGVTGTTGVTGSTTGTAGTTTGAAGTAGVTGSTTGAAKPTSTTSPLGNKDPLLNKDPLGSKKPLENNDPLASRDPVSDITKGATSGTTTPGSVINNPKK